ncbi:MAG: hypothetical protein INH37_13650 [Myxococcaceae bacterium]|nr:hypothetical protein [Myxococcaceae bacterium]
MKRLRAPLPLDIGRLLTPAERERIRAEVEASPGIMSPRLSRKRGRTVYVPAELMQAATAYRMAVHDKLPEHVRAHAYEHGTLAGVRQFARAYRKAEGAVKRTKAHRQRLALLDQYRAAF